jgi:hypothetical protein
MRKIVAMMVLAAAIFGSVGGCCCMCHRHGKCMSEAVAAKCAKCGMTADQCKCGEKK